MRQAWEAATMKPVCAISLIFLSLVLFDTPAFTQTLKGFEEEVASSPSSSKRNREDDTNGFWHAFFEFLYTVDGEHGAGRHLGPAFKGLLTGAWPTRWNNHNPYFWSASYSPYPYHTPGTGLFQNKNGRRHAISVTGHYLHSSRALRSYSVRSRFSPSPFYDIETHVSGFTETGQETDDHLAFYDVYINYHRVRSESVMFWYGAGIKGMQRENEYYGPAVNMGMEFYPRRPISLTGMINVGRLNSRSVWGSMFRINLHLNRSIVYVGYEQFAAGQMSIGGGIAGFGFYF